MRDAALTSALKATGGPSALALQLGITPQAVIQWERVPAGRVLDVEARTGVSRHALRPDIYGSPPVTTGENGAGAASVGDQFHATPTDHVAEVAA